MSKFIIPSLYILLLSMSAASCEFFELETAADETPGEGGWAGTEDAAHIQDDVLFLGGSGNLPAKVDLSPWLPPVMDQGQYGICVGCAVAYNQKTALNAISNQWNPSKLTNPAYQSSPLDLFLSIDLSKRGDLEHGKCYGTYFEHAYNQLQMRGAADCATAPFVPGSFDCSSYPAQNWTQHAASNRIESWREVSVNADVIREKLAQGLPVVIGANMRQDFVNHRYGVLHTNNGPKDMPHAMCVVGYDDALQAFKIVNSWGAGYHDNGFAWVAYDLFVQDFCRFAFVAYNSINPPNPDDPIVPPSQETGADLRSWIYSDAPVAGLERRLIFDVFNTGTNYLTSSPAWDVVYLYVNAYDMNDFGVILDHRITSEFGNGMGPYPQGIGSSGNWWSNTWLYPGSNLSQSVFGPQAGSISWAYNMPPLTGEYYMVLIADPFNTVAEPVEQDNLYYITNAQGGPIRLVNGQWFGFKSDHSEERSADTNPNSPVNPSHLNAYTPEELKFFLKKMRKNGSLNKGAKNAGNQTNPEMH